MVVAQLGRMGRSRTEPPEAHIYFTTLMYAGWAVPARAYGTRPEDWRSDLEHTYFSEPAPSDPKVNRTSLFRRSDGAGSDAAEHPSILLQVVAAHLGSPTLAKTLVKDRTHARPRVSGRDSLARRLHVGVRGRA